MVPPPPGSGNAAAPASALPPVLQRAIETDGYRLVELDSGTCWLFGRCISHGDWVELLTVTGSRETLGRIHDNATLRVTSPVLFAPPSGMTVALSRIRWVGEVSADRPTYRREAAE